MFHNCKSLLSLNLSNFNSTKVITYNDMFKNTNENLKICIDDNKFYNYNNSFSHLNIDCNYNCFYEHKYIEVKKECIDNCANDEQYNLEYNNICYDECPNGTFKSNDYLCEKYYIYDDFNFENIPEGYYLKIDFLKILDKCDNKCKKCTKESQKLNLCIECNIPYNYYPKSNNNINNNEFIECYNNETIEDNYFLDIINNIYIPCYSTCKTCNNYGNSNNHGCTSCIVNYILYETNCYNICEYYYYFNSLNEYKCTDNNKCPNNYSKLVKKRSQCIDNCLNDNIYKYEYNNECFDKCPNNTYYYNGEFYCYDNIPDGFYCNDSLHKTLDKCHENCKSCSGSPLINNNNCLPCKETGNIYLNLGNCIDNCTNGYYINKNSVKICKCIYNKKCYYCTEKSNELNLCIKCNKDEGYYQKSDDDFTSDGYIDCYKEPEGYYLNNEIYEKCYKTCKLCNSLGNEDDNKCTECFDEYIFINDFENIYNCYNICSYNYYYDKENNNKYQCTLEDNCPEKYNKFIEEKKKMYRSM